jgi:hypothetical protein
LYALHFGIVPIRPGLTPGIWNHEDPTTEKEVDLSWIDPERVDTRTYVSGSWACWGPDDQDTDGDNTLHVVVYVTSFDGDLVARIGAALDIGLSSQSRLKDFAIASREDWSEQQHIVTFAEDARLYYVQPRIEVL